MKIKGPDDMIVSPEEKWLQDEADAADSGNPYKYRIRFRLSTGGEYEVKCWWIDFHDHINWFVKFLEGTNIKWEWDVFESDEDFSYVASSRRMIFS